MNYDKYTLLGTIINTIILEFLKKKLSSLCHLMIYLIIQFLHLFFFVLVFDYSEDGFKKENI